MTEHRDIPRIGTPADRPSGGEIDGPPRAPSRRLGRLVEAQAVRRLAFSKIGRVGLGIAILAALTVVGGRSVSGWLVAWLHARPEHRISFGDLTLDPPPPPWIKGGRATLLEQIRGDRSTLGSSLDLDLDGLLIDFRRNPWVASADRAVRSFPDRVTVSLRYRRPVAIVRVGDRVGDPEVPIDAERVVLPSADVDLDKAGPLIKIEVPASSVIPSPGLAWPEGSEGKSGRFDRAFRLLEFFNSRIRDEAIDLPQLTPARIMTENIGPLVVMADDDSTCILWSRYQEDGRPGGPTDLDKWRWLVERVRGSGLHLARKKEYVDFTSSGLEIREARRAGQK